MTAWQVIANILSVAVFSFIGFAIWPSKRNVLVWTMAAPFVVGYLIPLLAVDYGEKYSQFEISLFTEVNIVGAVGMMLGCAVAALLSMGRHRLVRVNSFERVDWRIVAKRLFWLLFVSDVILTLCFLWMGFLPIFTPNPFVAKFFKGEYHDRFAQVAFFYRLAQSLAICLMPLGVVLWLKYRDKAMLIALLWCMVLFSVALTRSSIVAGIIMVISVAATRKWRYVFFYIAGVVLVYCLGSIVYLFLGLIEQSNGGLWVEIARGSPDVSDQLQFLAKFRPVEDLTYGLSFIGGLVPGNYHYNPSVLSLLISNDTDDISDIGSGGFRFTPALYGYIAFEWIGAFFAPFFSGMLTYFFVKKLKENFTGSLVQKVFAYQQFLIISNFFIVFYYLTYASIISIVFFSMLMWGTSRKSSAMGTTTVVGAQSIR